MAAAREAAGRRGWRPPVGPIGIRLAIGITGFGSPLWDLRTGGGGAEPHTDSQGIDGGMQLCTAGLGRVFPPPPLSHYQLLFGMVDVSLKVFL